MSAAGTAPTERVKIQVLDARGNPTGTPITAQFNPTSLQYTINNSAAQGSSRQRSRAVDESTGKLTMDLVFDTTDTGEDVRKKTQDLAKLMKPGQRQLTPVVQVTWGGIFKFKGALDQYRETLDFFSEDGVPLRASLSLGFSTVADQNTTPTDVFEFASTSPHRASVSAGSFQDTDDSFELPVGDDDSPGDIANQLGDPGRARDIAADNGIEDLRNGSDAGDVLELNDAPILDGPIAFATGGAGASAGFGASAGAGFGISGGAGLGFSAGATAGASFGASAGVSAGVSAGFGASASSAFGASASAGAAFGASASAGFGASAGASAGFTASASAGASASGSAFAGASFQASATEPVSASGTLITAEYSASYSVRTGSTGSAHVSASEGAFAWLRPPSRPRRRQIDVTRVLRQAVSPLLTTDNPTAFGPGGRVLSSGTSSVNAEVGQSFSLRDRIEFED